MNTTLLIGLILSSPFILFTIALLVCLLVDTMKSVFKAFKEKKYADIAFGFMFLCSIVGIILVCVGLDISEREAKEAKKLELESSNGK